MHSWARLANTVLYKDTGNLLEYRQLCNHPKHDKIWIRSFINKMGHLYQGVGIGPNGSGQRIEGMDTFFAINYEKISNDRRNEIPYTSVVCTVWPKKVYNNRTRITIGGNQNCYPDDVVTTTTYLEIVKLVVNSVISRRGACYAKFGIKNFYPGNLLNRPEYFKIQISGIPQNFIDKYYLETSTQDGWVYLEIYKEVYGLPQVRILANNLLRKRFGRARYYEAATTPNFSLNKWRPIQFYLIVNDFSIEYVEECYAKHFLSAM